MRDYGPCEGSCNKAVEDCDSTEKLVMKANISATIGNPDEEARDYLLYRLSSIHFQKTNKARLLFNMDEPSGPQTPKEIVDKIKAGKFTFRSEANKDGTWKDESAWHGNAINYISWRTEPADKEGFEIWEEGFDRVYDRTRDIIKVMSPADSLKALHEFENYPVTK